MKTELAANFHAVSVLPLDIRSEGVEYVNVFPQEVCCLRQRKSVFTVTRPTLICCSDLKSFNAFEDKMP